MEDAAPTELQLGECRGRYRGWRTVAAPPESPVQAIIVQFEACVKEDLRVGFAPPAMADTATHWALEVALGANGNTEVAWKKCLPPTKTKPPKEIDLSAAFTGRTCSGVDFVPYWVVVQHGAMVVGIGRQVGQDPLATATDDAFTAVQQVAFTTWNTGATIRQIRCEALGETIDMDSWTPRVIVRSDPYGTQDLLTDEQRNEYTQALETAKRRAERFGGGAFHAPDLKQFLDPKLVRKLQRTGATAASGFATGFDVTSTEEQTKREQRMKRFNTPQFAVDFSTDTARAMSEGLTQEEWQRKQEDREKLLQRAKKFGLNPATALRDGVVDLTPASDKVRGERCDVRMDTMVEFRDDAIHVYSLDERFQQVRTNDVLEYLAGYGPSYVEWINDSACTVVFEDPFTAARALISLSKEIPPQMKTVKGSSAPATEQTAQADVVKSEPTTGGEDVDMDGEESPIKKEEAETMETDATPAPEQVPDEAFNYSGWRYGLPIGCATQPSHKKWRLLLRKATGDDFPPEKKKKYHERTYKPVQRGRGHRSERNEARHHPYQSGGGRRRRGHRGEGGGRRRLNSDHDNDNGGGGSPFDANRTANGQDTRTSQEQA